MQSFSMKNLNELGINGSIFECVEFISMILLVKSEIYNKRITELFDSNDIENIVLSLDIWLNEGIENIAYDFIERAKSGFNPDKVSDLLKYYEIQVGKYVMPFFEKIEGKDIKFNEIIIRSQNCQDFVNALCEKY